MIDGISAARSVSPIAWAPATKSLEHLGLGSRSAAAGSARPRAPSAARARRGTRPAAPRGSRRRRGRAAARAPAAVRRGSGPRPACWRGRGAGGCRGRRRGLASGSSPAVTSSPVRATRFSMPCIEAPTISDCSASRLRSRQTSCMIGSTPHCFSAMATASGEACACAAVLSVALTASSQSCMGASWRRTSARPPPSIAGISAVITRWPARSLSSSVGMPARRRAPVASGDEVLPRRGALSEWSTGGRRWPRPSRHSGIRRERSWALTHTQRISGIDLAAAVGAHPAARPVAQRLGAGHRAGQPGRVQDALPAHLAAEDAALDRVLDLLDGAHGARPERPRA